MIKLVIDIFLGPVQWIMNLLPDFSNIFSFINNGFMGTILELAQYSSFIFPYKTLFICVGIIVTVFNMKFILSVLNWLIKWIPGVG